jgi:hypothetical protein
MISTLLNTCIEFSDNRSNPTVKEEGKSFTLTNSRKAKVTCIKVDGCIYKEEKTKCDYLMVAELNQQKAYFIELKGCDVPYGIDQLFATVKELKDNYSNYILEARISNKGNTPDVKNRKSYIDLAKIIFPTGGDILIRKTPFIEQI